MTRPVRLILDTSAIVAYTRGSVHVGEPIGEVEANGAVFGLPVACLACAQVELPWLDLIVSHPAAVVLATPAGDWRSLVATADLLGTIDAATAVLAAWDADCDVLSGEPGLYGPLGDDAPVIGI